MKQTNSDQQSAALAAQQRDPNPGVPLGEGSTVALTSTQHPGPEAVDRDAALNGVVSLSGPIRRSRLPKATLKSLHTAVRKAGGGTLTRVSRKLTLKKFFKVLTRKLNIQVKKIQYLKAAHVKKYVDYLKAKGVKHRTIQNELAHIRRALHTVHRGHYADSPLMSNSEMGVAGASRDGTHRPLTELQYVAVVAAAKAINPGAACCMVLQRELGLRAREAIQCVPSLASWASALTTGGSALVIHGTKGGRPRLLTPLDVQRALAAVRVASQVAKAQGGRLITSTNLRAAASRYGALCRSVGLRGEYASHALRCAYALDCYNNYLAQLGDAKEALAATSQALGHGDGRGKFVKQVYLKKPPRELPPD